MRRHVSSVLLALSVLPTLLVFVPAARAADAAYERDLISRLEAAFAPAGSVIVDGIPVHRTCASPLLLETRLRWPDLSAATRAQIAGVVDFDRPALPELYDTPDGLFRIHYTRTGSDSVNLSFGIGPGNVPNYVLNCAEILERVVAKQIDTLGFRFPVSDQIPRPGENPRFDIYFVSLANSFYGLTYPDTLVNNGPGNPWWATSWMELHSDYTKLAGYESRPFDAMEVTASHEFHHASQWSYDAFEAEERVEGGSLKSFPWWLEVSATAMEEIVFDDVNDYYGYLPFWFNNPNVSLRAFSNSASVDGLHPYASVIWALYLAQTQGPEILTEIWEEAGEVDGFN
ncbi:MAG TPA: MXAN_6640 family putative metalloprotease, partial [bacterium]|nr:MXAN_6640 family putative metalloprotease [bacterium]